MKYLGTERIVCSGCNIGLDVPVYINNNTKKYGFHFCPSCGTSLFYQSRQVPLSTDFVEWLTDEFYKYYCDDHVCDNCPFFSDSVNCTQLTGEERLAIIKRIHDAETKEK